MPLTTPLLLRRALLHRRGRMLTALAGLTLCAAIVTTMAALYADLSEKLNASFAAFGPNVVLSTHNGAPLPPDFRETIVRTAGAGTQIAEYGAVVADANGAPVAVVGTNLADALALHTSWATQQLQSDTAGTAPLLAGRRVWEMLGRPRSLSLISNGIAQTFTVTTVFSGGGPEDSEFYTDAAAFTQWTHQPPTTAEAHIPGSAQQVTTAVATLQSALPQMDVRPVRELVEGQGRIVERSRSLMFAAAAVVVATLCIAVLATLSAMVLDRRRDYAVMKALGCASRRLHRLFLMETAVLALAGGVLGVALGLASAFAVAEINFHTRLQLHWGVLPLGFLANALVAAVAAVWPLRALSVVEPAALLRGE